MSPRIFRGSGTAQFNIASQLQPDFPVTVVRTEIAMAPHPDFCFHFTELQWFRMAAAENRVAFTRARILSVIYSPTLLADSYW